MLADLAAPAPQLFPDLVALLAHLVALPDLLIALLSLLILIAAVGALTGTLIAVLTGTLIAAVGILTGTLIAIAVLFSKTGTCKGTDHENTGNYGNFFHVISPLHVFY